MKKLKVCIAILLIFILGILAGTLGTGFFIKNRIGRFVQGNGPFPPIKILERLSTKLDLSKSQQMEIEKIFNNTIEQIEQKLDKKQTQKLDKLTERLKHHFRNHPGKRPFLSEN